MKAKQYFCNRFSPQGSKKSWQRLANHLTEKRIKRIKIMYVIAEIQGQQFKIEQGKKLFVHHIQNAENGATVEFGKIHLADKDG